MSKFSSRVSAALSRVGHWFRDTAWFKTKSWFVRLGHRIRDWFVHLGIKIKQGWTNLVNFFRVSNWNVKASMCLMGAGQFMYHQIGKGLMYLFIEVIFILFFAFFGFSWIVGFFTLGTVEANNWTGQEGDNSVTMLILGIFSWIILIIFICMYVANVKDVWRTSQDCIKGKKPSTFKEDLKQFADRKFYKTVLFVPILGTAIFSVLPIIFMILIAFTNYGGDILPPVLVDWVGFDNFVTLFSNTSQLGSTFLNILGWNLLWGVSTTLLNYVLGLGLAILLNKKVVKGKAFWRLFPILAYAIPGFITLTAFKFMFSAGGPINSILEDNFGIYINFLGIDSTWTARGIGLLVNAWLSVPSVMLLATGILSNINQEYYEAASIDGASKSKQFRDITLPFVVFSTTPTLITSFINNFNNFGVFYFLRGTVRTPGYFVANDTDLLINWLYRLSIDNNYYSIGGAVSLLIFILTSAISLLIYVKSPAYRKEDTFR